MSQLYSSFLIATLAIYQTRVVYVSLTRETFRVDGVATVEIGGATLPDYFFDCNNTNNNGSGIRWSRQAGSEISTEPGTHSGLRLLLENVVNGDLDVYTCTDTLTGDSLNLNITDGRLAASSYVTIMVYSTFCQNVHIIIIVADSGGDPPFQSM